MNMLVTNADIELTPVMDTLFIATITFMKININITNSIINMYVNYFHK